MKKLRMYVVALAAACLASSSLLVAGCSKERARRITGPATIRVQDFTDAHWLTSPEELRVAVAGAAKSPLMTRAVTEQITDPRLQFLPDGVIAAVGTAPDGSLVRLTLLPYQYIDDPDHAVYFAMMEAKGRTRVETFEMFRNRKPADGELDFQPVNDGAHGQWLRSGPTYVQTQTGIARLAPERFNWQKFAWCFVPTADMAMGGVHDGCEKMGNFPGCLAIGSAVALAAVAIYCLWVASA